MAILSVSMWKLVMVLCTSCKKVSARLFILTAPHLRMHTIAGSSSNNILKIARNQIERVGQKVNRRSEQLCASKKCDNGSSLYSPKSREDVVSN